MCSCVNHFMQMELLKQINSTGVLYAFLRYSAYATSNTCLSIWVVVISFVNTKLLAMHKHIHSPAQSLTQQHRHIHDVNKLCMHTHTHIIPGSIAL